MKLHEYNEMMSYALRRRPMSNGGSAGFPKGNQAYLLRQDPPKIVKLKQLLNNLKPGDNFSISELAKKSGATRKTVSQYLKKDYPQLGLGTGSQTQRAALGQRAKDAADVAYKKLLDKGFLEDYKKRIQSPRSAADPSLSNKALAKKYFPNLSEVAAIGRLEKAAARIRKDNPELIYKKGDPKAASLKREERKKLFKSTEDEKRILRQQQSQKKIVNKYFQKNPEELLKKPKVKQMLDAKLVDGKLDFSPRYKTDKEYIDLAKSGKLFDEFDVTPIRTEKKNIQFPVNKNVGVGKFNQGFIKQVDAYFKKTKGSTEPDVLANKKAISDYLDSVGIRVEVEGERIGSKILPAIDRETGELPNIKNTLNKLEIGNLSVSNYIPPKTKNIERAVESINKSGPTLGANLGLLKGLGTAAEVAGTPAAAALFAADTVRRNIKEGQSLADAVVDPMVGVDLLLPTAASRLAPGVMRGVLGLGKVGRAFTPIGATLAIAGQGQEFYNQFQELQRLKEEDPEAYRKFIETRVTDPLTAEELADIEDMGREGAMYGGRMGFAEGPKDPGRRKFIKLMGILAALPYGIGKLVRTTESVAPVIKQGAKIGYDKFLELAAKIKILGKKDPGRTTMDRQEVTIYRGKDGSEYELTEDITTGDVRIIKDKPGMAQSEDEVYDTIQDRTTMEYKKGSTDVDPKTGKKIQYPDEYEEVKEVAGPDGTFDDIDEVDDIIAREIDEEIK
jgi:hypothetical protein